MEDHIKLYLLELSNNSVKQYYNFFDSLSLSRKIRVNSYLKQIDQKLSICSELLIKFALREISKENYYDIHLYHNNFGAVCSNIDNIYISLSHTNSIVVVAISIGKVGVDVEKIDRFSDMTYSDVGNILNNKEKEVLIKEPSSYLFSLIWTRKEAFGKYNNKGLIQDLSLINTLVNKKSTFNTISYKGYTISICSAFSRKVEVVKVTEEDLLESFNLR